MKRQIFILLGLLISCAPRAAVRNFTIEGNVTFIQDMSFQLDPSVTNGTPVKGFYVFDDSAADQNADATVGDYRFTDSAYGVTVRIGKYVFRTNPDHVNFLLEVVNRDQDTYLFHSYLNLSSTDLPLGMISWQLDDASGTALDGDGLPIGLPNLSAFADS